MPELPVTADWMTSKEAATVLRCDPKTVRNRLQAGTLPVRTVRFGRILRLSRADFQRYLDAGSAYTGSKVA
jgi:excisionase family DNA binding protein